MGLSGPRPGDLEQHGCQKKLATQTPVGAEWESFQHLRRQLGNREGPQPCLSPPWALLRGQQFLRPCWGVGKGLCAPACPESSPAQPSEEHLPPPSLPPGPGRVSAEQSVMALTPKGTHSVTGNLQCAKGYREAGDRTGNVRDRAHDWWEAAGGSCLGGQGGAGLGPDCSAFRRRGTVPPRST